MKSRGQWPIQIGDKVRHKKARRVAYVIALVPDVKGGLVLDRKIDGFRTCNERDLTLLVPA